jgi:hypothetical protein
LARWLRGFAALPTARSGIAGGVVGGRLFVFGGEGNPDSPRGTFAASEGYDPLSDTWFRFAPMPIPRHGMGGATLADAILVPGGADVQGFGASAANELVRPDLAEAARLEHARLAGRGRRGRVDLRLTVPGDAALVAGPVRLALADARGLLVELLLPGGALSAAGGGLRFVDPTGTASEPDGLRRLVVQRRGPGGSWEVTARARRVNLGGARAGSLGVGLTLGEARFAASGRTRARGGRLGLAAGSVTERAGRASPGTP